MQPGEAGGRAPIPSLAVAAVLLGCFIAGFHTRLFGIGLPDLRGAMGLDPDEGAWLSTVAMAPQMLVAPAIPWLVAVFGLRRMLIGPALVYAAVSLLIPLTRDYPTLLVLHALHGALLGAFVPAALMIIFRSLPMRFWTAGVAIYVLRAGFTLNAGVFLTGFYTQQLGWEWLYWQDVVLAPIMALLTWLGAPRVKVDRALLAKADWGGMILFGVGLTMVYVALDQGNRLDWLNSGVVVSLLVGGAVLFAGFLLNEAVVADPWASTRVLMSRNIALLLATSFCFTFVGTSNGLVLPNFLTVVRQLRPEQTGELLLLSVALPMVVLMPLALIVLKRVDARAVLMSGLASFALAAWLATGMTHDWAPGNFVAVALLQAFGQSFGFLALVLYGLANSDPAKATSFVAYIQIIRLLGTENGSSLLGTFVRVREQVHSNLIGLHLEAGDGAVAQALAGLSSMYASHGAAAAHGRALGTLAAMVQREAYTLAHIDAFRLAFWVAIVGMVLVACMGRAKPGPFTHRQIG
ncbi:MFS transporter [Ancylobacter oerskovii]|uniref:MFS transporter n=1 Tax=Ancylobacter oerskovii TaxID=459519 RepID=A0ABW4Z512_9HYPH|nr:MFS transporter [Ancylobacter oerskovii]MBS7542492.1 MFS transporter [Ancylobacter oerskovii]